MSKTTPKRERVPFPPGLWELFGFQALNGLMFAAWFPYVATVALGLSLDASELGTALFGLPAGLWCGTGVGALMQRWLSVRRVITISITGYCAGMAVVGYVTWAAQGAEHPELLLAAALFVPALFNGAYDPAVGYEINVFRRQVGRELQGYGFAAFAAAQVLQAGAAAVAIWRGVPAYAYLAGWAVVGTTLAVVGSVRLLRAPAIPPLPAEEAGSAAGTRRATRARLAAMAAVGALAVIFLANGTIEGIWADWHGVYLSGPGIAAPAALAAVGYVCYQATSVVARVIGPSLVGRYGSMPVLLGASAIATAGATLIVVAQSAGLALVGALVLGLGASYIGPLAQSAAGEDKLAVTIVTATGYSGLLAAPAALGFLAEAITLRVALALTLCGGPVLAAVLAFAARDRFALVDRNVKRSEADG